jgi:hypothetical protein
MDVEGKGRLSRRRCRTTENHSKNVACVDFFKADFLPDGETEGSYP